MTDLAVKRDISASSQNQALNAGSSGRRVAIINGQVIEAGQKAKVTIGKRVIVVRCLEIKEKSAVISIEGISAPKEIVLPCPFDPVRL